jgi:hypothetical protein
MTLKRVLLKRRGPLIVTGDTFEALDRLEARAKEHEAILDIRPLDLKGPRHLSLVPAGRLFKISFYKGDVQEGRRIAFVWSLAIPERFTPWDRNPVPSETQGVFSYLGPWEILYERLVAEGRGDVAWLSVCVAAQCDAGVWEGDRPVERFVQAQLHRVGQNCGPLDGIIGPRTVAAIKALGLEGLKLEELAAELMGRYPAGVIRQDRKYGHLSLGVPFTVETFGLVKKVRNPAGASFIIEGPGRILVEIEGGPRDAISILVDTEGGPRDA